MDLQEFLDNSWDDEYWSSDIRVYFKNDNLDNIKQICNFIDKNNSGPEDYEYLFNISFNMNCIRIFTFLWKNKRKYADIHITNKNVSKKSKIGEFYFDELYKEDIIGNFFDHCYRKNIYNISHILTYLIEKDYDKYLFLCKEAYFILTKNSIQIESDAKKCLKLILLFDDNVSKYIFNSVNYNYFYKFPKIDVARKPISHSSKWKSDKNDTPFKRAQKAKAFKFINLRNFDIILNKNETGYRNAGVYIYKDNELYELSSYPDDYGSLPEWVDIRKEDCGHSYFSEGLIDNNTLVPFKTNEWKIGSCFTVQNKDIQIELHREKDNAKCIVKTNKKKVPSYLEYLFKIDKVVYFESEYPCELRFNFD